MDIHHSVAFVTDGVRQMRLVVSEHASMRGPGAYFKSASLFSLKKDAEATKSQGVSAGRCDYFTAENTAIPALVQDAPLSISREIACQ